MAEVVTSKWTRWRESCSLMETGEETSGHSIVDKRLSARPKTDYAICGTVPVKLKTRIVGLQNL